MAETLLAILLVTSSAKGSSLVFHWPPSPSVSPRLARPRPLHDAGSSQFDGFWLASNKVDASVEERMGLSMNLRDSVDDGWDYEWKRPSGTRERSRSFARSRSRPGSTRNSPSRDSSQGVGPSHRAGEEDYDNLLGYSAEFLANILCPQRTLCHQKFELVVDDLAFLGHPVCAEVDGEWRFKPEKPEPGTRGRGSRNRKGAESVPAVEEREREPSPVDDRSMSHASSMQIFHFVLVMDLPDPSSSASGNLFKYFHVIYEHIGITVTAVLFQEQVMHGFMDTECDVLGALRDGCGAKGEPFSSYITQALQMSSLARSMKILYESIKSNSTARLTINELGIELQLPPYLDSLLHTEDDDSEFFDHEDIDAVSWTQKLSFGWRLPTLAPWKSLLLHDMEVDNGDLVLSLRRPGLTPEDQELAEGLIQFLQTASVFDSLAVMAHSLDWDLETQVYPTVRWLVEHRKAKVVDTVHPDLKTVFVLPSKLAKPLPELSSEFAKDFPQPTIPPLPKIFAVMSSPSSSLSESTPMASKRAQVDNHFFATVVRAKDLLPLYRDVVLWLLKRDLLVTLHLRVRVVATPDVKLRVRRAREQAAARRRVGTYPRQASAAGEEDGDANEVRSKPEYTRGRRRRHSAKSAASDLVGTVKRDQNGEDDEDDDEDEDEEEEVESGTADDETGWDVTDDNLLSSIISDPGQATPLERKWLEAMSDDKDPELAHRFEQINQYFDGKRTNDEILYRAEISRRQLREVLHHYEEYLLTLLHPA